MSYTKIDALKGLYQKLGGTDSWDGVNLITEAIDKVTEVATGGGGSSDFSTATITFHLTYPEGVTPVMERFQTFILNYPTESSEYVGSIVIDSGVGGVILLNNYAEVQNIQALSSNDEMLSATNVVLSGNIEYDEQGFYKVTGDCTFTADMVIDS